MFKPIGSHIILKVLKQKSTIHLLEESDVKTSGKDIIVYAVGDKAVLGLKEGDKVITDATAAAMQLEDTEDHTLILVPEHIVKAIKQ